MGRACAAHGQDTGQGMGRLWAGQVQSIGRAWAGYGQDAGRAMGGAWAGARSGHGWGMGRAWARRGQGMGGALLPLLRLSGFSVFFYWYRATPQRWGRKKTRDRFLAASL